MTSPLQPVPTPPAQPSDEELQHIIETIAALIAARASTDTVIAAAERLLTPFGMQPAAIGLAARLTWQISSTTVATVAGLPANLHYLAARYALGQAGTHALRSLASASPAATAAYFVNASQRLQTAIDEHGLVGLGSALGDERRYFLAHVRAQRARTAAAAAVDMAAREHGRTLGWYAHDDDRTTPECAQADGSNFDATRVPAIGWPGTPHGGTCRCWAGPAHITARSTYDVQPLGRAAHDAYDRTADQRRRTA